MLERSNYPHWERKEFAPFVFNLSEDQSQLLYDDTYYVATRRALSSLAGDNDVDKTVINIWVHILNVCEQYRDRFGVHRVFFTSEALDLYIKTKDEPQAKAAFFHRLNEELSLTLHVKFKEVDLQTKQSTLLGEYLVKEWSDDRRGTSIKQFQERHIDMPWKIDSSKQDHNGGIYVMMHMEEYKCVVGTLH